jgi:hypothetical protein
MTPAHNALVSADAAAISMTVRKLAMKDSSITLRSARRYSGETLRGTGVLASSSPAQRIARSTAGGADNVLRCSSSALLKTARAMTPRTVTANNVAARETALFMPEAVPA